jgi:hypothetical protein
MVKEAQRMAAAESSPVEGKGEEGTEEDPDGDGSVEVRSLSDSSLPRPAFEIAGEVLTIESNLSAPARRRGGRLSSEAQEQEEGLGEGQKEELREKPPSAPVATHPTKNLRSLKVRQSLLPIEEVVSIAELERFQKPNSDLLSRVRQRLEESAKERAADQNHWQPIP